MNIAPAAPRMDTPPTQKAKWTILLYSAADNSLTDAMLGNIYDIEKVGSDSYTNIAAQVDTGPDCKRYFLQKNNDSSQISSPVVGDLGQVDMASPKTLADFVTWGVKTYPAEHYMVIISDHGNGWQGAVEDDSAGTWMALPQHRQAFEQAQAATGQKIDIIGYDACLMASAEVAHELKDVANYLVVSQETEGAAGWPYSRILNPQLLKNLQAMHLTKLTVEPAELAVECVKASGTTQDVLPTMTAVDTSKVPALTSAIDGLGKAIVNTSTDNGVLGGVVSNTQAFTDYKDAYDFASKLQASPDIKDDALKAAAKGVTDAVTGAVMLEEHSDQYPGAHGLTLEISTDGLRTGYTDLKFAQDTSWPAALTKMAGTPPTPPPTDPPSGDGSKKALAHA